MRLDEFAPTKLSSLMAFLANKIQGDDKEIPMKAFIAMGHNMGIPLNYIALKKAYDENPNLQNLIADLNQDSIILKSPDEIDTDTLDTEQPEIDADKKVNDMAKRALNKRR
jgi:hypothetical protein